MKELKTKKDVVNFFKGQTLKFKIFCDGVAEYKTTTPIKVHEDYFDFTVSFFNDENVLLDYSKIDGMLESYQVFQVTIHYHDNSKETIYHQKYIDYKNN